MLSRGQSMVEYLMVVVLLAIAIMVLLTPISKGIHQIEKTVQQSVTGGIPVDWEAKK